MENTVAPIRMNITKLDSLVVAVKACLSRLSGRRPRNMPMTMAPTAPMAPPSVGVATPRKMVPSTRKISSSGGISTNVTRSARRDSRFSFSSLLAMAMMKATKVPPHTATTTRSSVATTSTGLPNQACTASRCSATKKATMAEMPNSTHSEV